MDQNVLNKIIKILFPYAKNREALRNMPLDLNLKKDLEVDSLRLVDIVLNLEDEFHIEFKEHEFDGVNTIRDIVELVKNKVV